MKALVLQISSKQAAVLADDGCAHNIPNRNYQVGDRIELTMAVRRRPLVGWAVAAAAVLCVGTTGAWATLAPYYYVSLDVNPSVEYTLNRFDRVLSVKGVNDDGSALLLELDNLGNKTIDMAISETVDRIHDKGYLEGELEGGVVISTSAKDIRKAERLASHLRDEVAKSTRDTDKPINIEAIAVARERVDEAHELGITPGKLNLITKLKEATGDANMSYDVWLNKPVKEIMKAIKDNKIDAGDLDDPLDGDHADTDDADDDKSSSKPNGKPESKPDNPNKPTDKPNKEELDDKYDDLDDLHDEDDDKPNSKPDNPNKPTSKPDKDKSSNGKAHQVDN